MANEHKAALGSISTGTLKTDDLIDAFVSELEWLLGDAAKESALVREANQWLEANSDTDDADNEEGAEIVNDLQDALSELAPLYCYFGSTEGDGADFGFWPSMESINELPRVENSDEAKELGEDAIYVNDHGNVTVYGGDGSVILELV